MKRLAIIFLFLSGPVLAQPAPRPTAIQILSNQLAIAIAQNAELHEKVGQLEDRIAKMIQERSQPPKEKPE